MIKARDWTACGSNQRVLSIRVPPPAEAERHFFAARCSRAPSPDWMIEEVDKNILAEGTAKKIVLVGTGIPTHLLSAAVEMYLLRSASKTEPDLLTALKPFSQIEFPDMVYDAIKRSWPPSKSSQAPDHFVIFGNITVGMVRAARRAVLAAEATS